MSTLTQGRFGTYLIDERIAVGGMAEIYRAHTSSGEPVAIKVILPRLAEEQKFIQMFLDEAKIAVALRHPNIVQMLDFGKIDDTYFFSMEWVDGKPLSAVIRRQMELSLSFPVEVAILIMVHACRGLAYAHSRRDRFDRPLGIVHRDISPPNILLMRTGKAKVADFGIADAKHKAIQTLPGVIRGKFSYMSPEQARGEVVDHRSDIFSLGIVLHELLTGSRLFLREQDTETLKAVRECKIPNLADVRPDVSPTLERIVQKSLHPNKAKRYFSAWEMGQELKKVLAHEYADIESTAVAEFLKVLYPWETFIGVQQPVKELLAKWRERERIGFLRAQSPPMPVWMRTVLSHRYEIAVALGMLTIGALELLLALVG